MASYSLDDGEVLLMYERLEREFLKYAESRKHDVERGAETPDLAAELVNKWTEGAQAALRTIEFPRAYYDKLAELADRLVLEIDPNFKENRRRRFKARPASLAYGPDLAVTEPQNNG